MRTCIVLLCAIIGLMVCVSQTIGADVFKIKTAAGYTTMKDCDDVCLRHKDTTVCKLDCKNVDTKTGKGDDCIFHFYDKTSGNIVHHCWE